MKNEIVLKIKKIFLENKKPALVIIAGITAIILIAVSEKTDNTDIKKKSTSSEAYCEQEYEETLEKRIEGIISKIDGVGNAEVLIKTESAEKYEYIKNQSSDLSEDSQSSESEYVIINEGSDEKCVIAKKDYPKIQGVIIVCQGGDNSKVQNDVTNAVASLLGVSTYNISVLKMKQTED